MIVQGKAPAEGCRSRMYTAQMQEKDAVKQRQHRSRRNLTKPNQSSARSCKKGSDSTSLIATISSQRGIPNAEPSGGVAVRRAV